MGARNPFDRRLRQAADRADAQQDDDEPEPVETTPEPERIDRSPDPEPDTQPDPEPDRQSSVGSDADGALRSAARERDRDILEEVADRQQEVQRADRRLQEAARERERQAISGGDADDRLQAAVDEQERRQQRIQEQESQFDQTLQRAAEQANRDRKEDIEQQIVERELETQETLREIGEQAETATQDPGMVDPRVERGVADERLEGVDAREELEEASADIRGGVSDFFGQDIALLGGESLTEGEGVTGSVVRGAEGAVAGIADVPGTALQFAGAGEFAGERGAEVLRGEADQAAETTAQAADDLVSDLASSARQDPVEFGTTLGVSLGATAAGFGAASAIGPRAGLATRAAVQPGEELIGQVGGRATRAIGGQRAAERLFPNNEPVFLSEEVALRGAQRAADATRRGIERARGADVSVAGPGMGFPAVEVELRGESETEQTEPPDFRDVRPRDPLARPERNERLRERARNRGRNRQDLGPNRRGRRRRELETETESELETEIEQELETRRRRVESTLLGFDQQTDLFAGTDVETRLQTRQQQAIEGFQEVELRTGQEQRTEAETRPETETRAEARAEPRREVEFFDLDAPAEEAEFIDPADGLEGVRAVEAFIDPTELEVD